MHRDNQQMLQQVLAADQGRVHGATPCTDQEQTGIFTGLEEDRVDILHEFLSGYLYREIAERLNIPVHQVDQGMREIRWHFEAEHNRELLFKIFGPAEETALSSLCHKLTAHQRTFLPLLLRGMKKSEISKVSGTPVNSLNKLQNNIYIALGVRSIHELFLLAHTFDQRQENPGARVLRGLETISPLLTRKELEILPHLMAGLSGKEMAVLSGCSVRTVRSHAHNIYTKAGLHGRKKILCQSFGEVTSDIIDRAIPGLTGAERNVALLLAEGKKPREICSTLNVGLSTVRTHIAHIRDKADVRSIPKLIAHIHAHAQNKHVTNMLYRLDQSKQDVFRHLVQGSQISDIAERSGRPIADVIDDIKSIYRTLEVTSRYQLFGTAFGQPSESMKRQLQGLLHPHEGDIAIRLMHGARPIMIAKGLGLPIGTVSSGLRSLRDQFNVETTAELFMHLHGIDRRDHRPRTPIAAPA